MGRILRIGTDAGTNYTLLSTSAYDAANPAATTSAWPDDAAADQDFTDPNAVEVDEQGCVITFTRRPDTFLGAMVKIKATYDTSIGEAPSFEMWTHANNVWTLRRSIALTNVFVGAPSGVKKILDLTFFPFLRDVDRVWLTMNPGTTGSPTNAFFSIQLFGQCEGSLRNDSGGPGSICDDPNGPFYTGFDEDGNPCPGTTFGPPPITYPTIDVCNPASIEQYRQFAATIPGYLEVFNAWLDTNANAISLYCAGINSDPPAPPTPPGTPPPLPPLDLCDEDSIDAFRAALAGDADHLAAFDDYIDGLTADGFFDLVCPEPEPDEVYVDPMTLRQAPDPDADQNTPFGSGPGGQPQFPRPAPRRNAASDNGDEEDEFHFLFMPGSFAKDFLLANLAGQPQVIQDAINNQEMRYVQFGNDAAVVDGATTAFARMIQMSFECKNLIPGNVVGVKTYWGEPFTTSSSVFTIGGGAVIDASGYTPTGPGNARFELESTDFGLEDVISISGHKTFLRESGSGANDTLAFNVTADNGPIGGGDGYIDNFLDALIIPLPGPTYAAGQTSVALYGFYVNVVVKRKKFQFAVTVTASAQADTADHRAAVNSGPFCTLNGCTIE